MLKCKVIENRLTDSVIDQLGVYFGNAIRANPNDFVSMRKAAWAVWNHKASSDEKPLHHFYPTGPESWLKGPIRSRVQDAAHPLEYTVSIGSDNNERDAQRRIAQSGCGERAVKSLFVVISTQPGNAINVTSVKEGIFSAVTVATLAHFFYRCQPFKAERGGKCNLPGCFESRRLGSKIDCARKWQPCLGIPDIVAADRGERSVEHCRGPKSPPPLPTLTLAAVCGFGNQLTVAALRDSSCPWLALRLRSAIITSIPVLECLPARVLVTHGQYRQQR
ncbi:hypothetical protein J6590_027621 [Homalodisca vitripennis]|nr:hypothetical protein J6590_027621 [Homalodisca vitripennis]